MSYTEVPAESADRMVELLFDNRTPKERHRILYPACGHGELIDAVHRFVANHGGILAGMPEGVAIDSNEEYIASIGERYDDIDVIHGDFLDTGRRLDDFDYILCNPPVLEWSEKSAGYRRDRAADFGFISGDDESVNEDMLFFEQSLRYLKPNGRAVFFTSPTFKTAEAAAGLRDRLFYRVEDIEEVKPSSTSIEDRHVITTVSNEAAEAEGGTRRYEPARFEALLGTRVDAERPFSVEAVMTPSPEGYGPEIPVPEAYLDLLYNDYDAAPVYTDSDSRSGLQGYIAREHLKTEKDATVADQYRPLDENIVLPSNASFEQLIERLGNERFQFVGSPDAIVGIVTRFDLNRLPVLVHLYDCLSEFEIGLRQLIRREAPDWEERASISIHRRPEAEVHVDRLSGGKLSDLLTIVDDLDLETSILRDIDGYDVDLDDISKLRDSVAHYNPIVHTMEDGATDGIQRGAEQLAAEYRFLQACIGGLNASTR